MYNNTIFSPQIKSIARKYKTQCQELTEKSDKLEEQVKQLLAQIANTPVPAVEITPPPEVVEISVEEQNRLRQEGRQQLESEMNDRIKLLNEKVRFKRRSRFVAPRGSLVFDIALDDY